MHLKRDHGNDERDCDELCDGFGLHRGFPWTWARQVIAYRYEFGIGEQFVKSLVKISAAAFLGLVMLSGGASAQYCEGTVFGLSSTYNLAKGTGFLAVRSQPKSSARMVGQFFNGDTTEIMGRQGNWYRVAIGGIDGWASSKWIRNSCNY